MPVSAADEWDCEAERFDDEPDHGLTVPAVRRAWQRLLYREIPSGAAVLDVGCGTGTLSVLLAEHGCTVTGVDLAPRMLHRAKEKASKHGVSVLFALADASDPPVRPAFEIVLARHVVWALPDPAEALERWLELMPREGRLVLIEGLWSTGAGLSAKRLARLLRPKVSRLTVHHLEDAALWGREIGDERYLLVADK